MKLIIMRHGEAERFQTLDKTRNLTNLGRKQASQAGRWLNTCLGPEQPVDIALISSYIRARQTFEQLCEMVAVTRKKVCEDVVPEGDPKIVHDLIKALFNDKSKASVVLIVSHMPFVSYFLEEVHVDKKSMLFGTSSMVVINYDLVAGAGKIESIYHPV
jgi:phosphohistidine phosphatase